MPNRYNGIELARTGTFDASTGKVTLTSHDFANMVSAFAELKGAYGFPLKLGHNHGQPLLKNDGLPAAGWLSNVRVDGDLLIADFVDVPNGVAALIDQKALRTRSIEYQRNIIVAGKRYPIVLTACALLGEQLPAVDSLSDIAALYAAASLLAPVFDGEPVMALATSTDLESNEEGELAEIIGELLGALEKAEGKIHGKQGAPALRSLVATTLRELKRVASGQFRKELSSMKKVTEFLKLKDDATEDEILAAAQALAAAANKPEDKPGEKPEEKPDESPAMLALRKETEEQSKKILQLEQAQALSLATTTVDDAIKAFKFLPAAREQLIKMAAGNPDSFAELVKATPANAALSKGEIGTSADKGSVKAGDFDPEKFEPTEGELAVALAMGNTRETVIRQKAEDAGVKVPDSFGKPEETESQRLASAIEALVNKSK